MSEERGGTGTSTRPLPILASTPCPYGYDPLPMGFHEKTYPQVMRIPIPSSLAYFEEIEKRGGTSQGR